MGKPRYAAKVDANQNAIVDELRARGFSVELDHDDILVGAHGLTFWYEIKNKKGKNKVLEDQERLDSEWKGHYKIVHAVEDIIEDIKECRSRLQT